MLIETSLPERDLRQIPGLARQAEALGFDGISQPELKHDPLFTLALAAPATERAYLASSVLIAFPRSPMVVAYQSHDLQALSGGRLVVGLGTQVKGHIQRRFSTVWDSPGPRLREYVLSLRAIWDTWQNGTPLDFQGDFYNFTLMTPEFSPEAHAYPPPRVEIAAVNNYNARLAGEVCDGLRVHPMTTPGYLRDVLWPQVRRGAKRSGRSLDNFRMIGGGFIATGPDAESIEHARENARYRIAFYASTRTYLPVLEHHGWQDINDKLRRLIAESRWDDLPSVIPDEILDGFCISGSYQEIPGLVKERLGGLVDCLSLSLPADPTNPSDDYREFLARMREIPGVREKQS
ncbi:MAG TPA: TIGR03617 family F420-dependent LLM class oxidoreductase [Thermomicrobiaceae bacterium]|nr:TIGR03617 family F420-dependent LLM class oxidoreductase [Thermomicrobiaceae bacterium]